DAARARDGWAALRAARLSKYTPPVQPVTTFRDHILVVDQTAGDASIRVAGAGPETFQKMLAVARAEHPGSQIVVKTHPDVMAGRKNGHFRKEDLRPDEVLLATDINPWDLIENARAIYTVSSQIGYEAALAERPVRCFGSAFYAGWGLTQDEVACERRDRTLSPDELFAGCHLRYPVYYDPFHDRLGTFEETLSTLALQLAAETPAPDCKGEVFVGVRRWKRRNLTLFRPSLPDAPVFAKDEASAQQAGAAPGRQTWFWASKSPLSATGPIREAGGRAGFVEDGFLRSVGLGAALTQPASLVFDHKGIYFDPSAPSDLEELITQAAEGAVDLPRAAALRQQIVAARVSKYNVGAGGAISPKRKPAILVPGQVEDDASILRGTDSVRTNLDLLRAVRARNPDAWIIYKPHPDVEAGLRKGVIAPSAVAELADSEACDHSPTDLIDQVDAVWTMTSLLGFEALLRGVPVTCLGAPFYAGWGLTTDLGAVPDRRQARPSLDALIWASLIAYPSYRDPVTGLPCSPELIVERLATGVRFPKSGTLSRLQTIFARQSWLWRR
ncbi:MAG: capsular polysaccharide biosynthesis protein, partial [Pseudomonadota bacterium]